MNPTSNQIQNKSLVAGTTITDALNTLRITSGGSGSGDMSRSVYDTDSDGKVDVAELADSVPWTGVTSKPSTFPPQTHSHTTTDVVGLDTALAGKAATSHTHTISNVTGLQTALDGKAATSHTHVITDVTDLQTTLDGKANLSGDNTFTGSVNYSGSAKRFQADFSNTTVANRLMFQSSTANNSTIVAAAPNGTSTVAGWQARNNSDVANASTFTLSIDSTQALLNSAQNGTGAFLPMAFATGGVERFRLDATSNRFQADFSNALIPNRFAVQTSTANGNTFVHAIPNGTATASGFIAGTNSDATNYNSVEVVATTAAAIVRSGQAGSGSVAPLELNIAATKCMRLDPTTFAFTSVNGAIGYGTGAGGSANQPTTPTLSKANPVTLNKPSGVIAMNNAALSSGAMVSFDVNNSYVALYDGVLISMIGAAFTHGNYRIWVGNVQAGKFTVYLENRSGGSLSEAVTFAYQVIKGSNA